MSLKPYVLLVQTWPVGPKGAKVKLAPARVQEIKRILGEGAFPIMAWDIGAVLGFESAESADLITARILKAIGVPHQIVVLEMGKDRAQHGSPIPFLLDQPGRVFRTRDDA